MSTFVSLSELVDWLKFKASIQASEESAFSMSNLRVLITRAVSKHNPNYVVSDAASSVPDRERDCVTILAWAEVSLIRASQLSTSADNTANGFSNSVDSPFARCLKLRQHLIDVEYPKELQALGIASDTVGPSVSELIVTDKLSNVRTNPLIAKNPPPISISSDGHIQSNSAVVSLSCRSFSDFKSLKVFTLIGTDSIREVWNFASSVFPQISESADVIDFNELVPEVKLTNLPAGPSTVKVLAVVTNINQLSSYSNELVLTIP